MSTLSSRLSSTFDVEKIREDFPVLKQTIHGKPLVYLDSAATAQKPFAVIDAIRKFHEVDCAIIHRGIRGDSHQGPPVPQLAQQERADLRSRRD
jgi:cysteine desulfurase/selenocysteine lyase